MSVNAAYAIVFYIGHGNNDNPLPFGETQGFISADDVGTKLYDHTIFDYSSFQRVKLAFLWSCKQADTVGGTHWSGIKFGMPYAWLHNESISQNGYTNPDSGGQAFLGFEGDVYGFSDFIVGTDLQQFLNKFYFSALCYGASYSVNSALDYAARLTWPNAASFAESWLYKGYNEIWRDINGFHSFIGRMKVYGDGSMHLSALHSAMKTRADGFFYRPVAEKGSVKIELLLGNQDLTGDQTGDINHYGTIANYPDGTVDMSDVSFIVDKFGSSENQSNWDYMADIVPDRTIDMADVSAATDNFMRTGSYIKVLSNVTILFNTGQEISPDSNGFVTIPQYASNFTVRRYGNSTGAMVVFW